MGISQKDQHSLKQLPVSMFILHRIQRAPHCPVRTPSWAPSRSCPAFHRQHNFLGKGWRPTGKEQSTTKQTPNHRTLCCLAVRLESSEFPNFMGLGSLSWSLSWWPCSHHGADAEAKKLICCLLDTKGSSNLWAFPMGNSLSLFHLLANAPYPISLSVNFTFHYPK